MRNQASSFCVCVSVCTLDFNNCYIVFILAENDWVSPIQNKDFPEECGDWNPFHCFLDVALLCGFLHIESTKMTE